MVATYSAIYAPSTYKTGVGGIDNDVNVNLCDIRLEDGHEAIEVWTELRICKRCLVVGGIDAGIAPPERHGNTARRRSRCCCLAQRHRLAVSGARG